MSTMRAAVVDRYGPPEVVHVETVTRPPVAPGELGVRVLAAPVTSGDARIRGARFPHGFGFPARLALGITRPRRRILGMTFAGVVEGVGAGVDGFRPGELVCGMTGTRMGTHAEFVVVPADRVARIPEGVGAEDAAGLLFGGTTALHFLRDRASVAPGKSVLINGASGAVGTSAVQLAKHFGGVVTGVTSGANASLVADLGADDVIDYTVTDWATAGRRFDVVLDCVGNITMESGRKMLTESGVLCLAVAGLRETVRARGNVVAGPAPERVEDYETLLALVGSGALKVVHGGAFPLGEIVNAHRLVDTGHKVGNVLVRPTPE